MMEVPIIRIGRYPSATHITVQNELLDLTPLDYLEWHAVVIYHREMYADRYKDPYPDNYDLTLYSHIQPPKMKYIFPILGPDFQALYSRRP